MGTDFEEALKTITPSESERRRLSQCRDSLIGCIDSAFQGNPNYQGFKIIGSAATGNFLRGYRDIDGTILFTSSDFTDFKGRLSRIRSLEKIIFREKCRIVSAKANFQFNGYNISLGVIEQRSNPQISLSMDMLRHPDFILSNLRPSQRGDILLTKQLFRNLGVYGKKVGGFACEQLVINYGSFSEFIKEILENRRIFVDFSGRYSDDNAPMVVSYPFCGLDNLTADVTSQDIAHVREYLKSVLQRPHKFTEDSLAIVNREFWSNRAKDCGNREDFSIPDVYLNRMENRLLRRRILQNGNLKILDVGCANGFTTLAVSRSRGNQIFGVDSNVDAIRSATDLAVSKGRPEIQFISADMTYLPFESGFFDVVYAKRALVNLPSMNLQDRAVAEIYRVLKSGGEFLLFDLFREGYERINQRRTRLGLTKMELPYHITLLSEESIRQMTRGRFFPLNDEDPTSTYYLFSRVIYPFVVQQFGKNVKSNSIWNRFAAILPSIGGLGINKLYTFKKA